MYFFRFAVLIVLLVSNTAIAETDFGAILDIATKAINAAAKNKNANSSESSGNSTETSQGSVSENGQPLKLERQPRSLDKTLRLISNTSLSSKDLNGAGLFVTPNGKLVVWGSNEEVRFGLAEANYRTSAGLTEYTYQKFYKNPVVHPAFDDAEAVDTCGTRTLVLTKKGEVWILGKGVELVHADAFAPVKLKGDGYIDARIVCDGRLREFFHLLKSDGTYWMMGGSNQAYQKPVLEPKKLLSGVKSLKTLFFSTGIGRLYGGSILLLDNGKVAGWNIDFYKDIGFAAKRGGLPTLMEYPNLKDIVRIDSSRYANIFTAYGADGQVYEIPLSAGGKSSRLANGLVEYPKERIERLDLNNVKNGPFYYYSPQQPAELADAKTMCYAVASGWYGLMLDKSGNVSVWSLVGKTDLAKKLGLQDKLIPQIIPSVSNIEDISCYGSKIVLKNNNGDISFIDFGSKPANTIGIKPTESNKFNQLFNDGADFYTAK